MDPKHINNQLREKINKNIVTDPNLLLSTNCQ